MMMQRSRETAVSLLLAMLAFLTYGCATTASNQRLDIKVTNGRIVDGTGAPWFRADVGIIGDTIVAVGDLSTYSASQTVDARDTVVSPGFIDLLGQSQGAVLIDPKLEGKVRQGVTTEITGEGHSPGPINDEMARLAQDAEPGSPPPSWRTLGEYMTRVERGGTAINFAFLVGSSNPRSMVIGAINRDPTAQEMERMKQVVDLAMRDGAIGLSTSLIYVPAVFSKTEEIIALAKVAARYDGVYFTHLRNENDEIVSALEEAFRIGREAGIPVNVWHLKVGGKQNWGRMSEVISLIERQRREGLDVSANIYPYIASSTSLTALAPNWALEGGYTAFLDRIKQPELRTKIGLEIKDSGFYSRVDGGAGVLVTKIPNPEFATYEKHRLNEISEMMQLDEAETLMRLYESSRYSPSAIYFSMNEDDVKHALRQPFVSVGADSGAVVGEGRKAGAHPRAYGTFPRIVGHYVRDEKLFTLEEAVRKLTSQAAARVQLQDRGIIRPGMKADLIIFDPQQIRDVSTYEDPHHYSEGVSHVMVNGRWVLEGGAMTTNLPGRVLRGKGYKPPAKR